MDIETGIASEKPPSPCDDRKERARARLGHSFKDPWNIHLKKNMKDPLKIYSKSVKDPLIHDFHSPAHPGHPPCRHRCLFRQGHRVRSEPGCSVRVGWSQVKPPWNMGKFHGKIHGNFGLTNPWIDGKNWSMMLQYLFLLPHFKCDITGLCTNLGTRMKNI